MRAQLLSQVPQVIGNGGDASVVGVDSNGNLMGNGTNAGTTAHANFELSTGVLTTNVDWTATASWNCYTYSDGYVYIKLTITWGSNSANSHTTIDIKTNMTNAAASNSQGPIPVVFSGMGFNSAGGYGSYYLQSYPATYGYLGADGSWNVVGYTAYEWVWIPGGGGGGNHDQE